MGVDELDKLGLEFFEKRKKASQTAATLRDSASNRPNVNSTEGTFLTKHSALHIAGQISIGKDSSFDVQSTSSKQHSARSKSKKVHYNGQIKAGKSGRVCGCKTKTE